MRRKQPPDEEPRRCQPAPPHQNRLTHNNVFVSSRRNSTRPRTSRPTSSRKPPGNSYCRTSASERVPRPHDFKLVESAGLSHRRRPALHVSSYFLAKRIAEHVDRIVIHILGQTLLHSHDQRRETVFLPALAQELRVGIDCCFYLAVENTGSCPPEEKDKCKRGGCEENAVKGRRISGLLNGSRKSLFSRKKKNQKTFAVIVAPAIRGMAEICTADNVLAHATPGGAYSRRSGWCGSAAWGTACLSSGEAWTHARR